MPLAIAVDPLCQDFLDLAKRTWNDLGYAAQAGHSLAEESITDYLLLDLKRRAPTRVSVRKFSRREEGRTTGADWEWWFVQGSRGFGMRVQAKRLNTVSQRYDTLDHVVRRTRQRQVNLLIRDAQAASPPLYPLYFFYNHVPAMSLGPPTFLTLHPACSLLPQAMGCSIADAYRIRSLLSSKIKRTDFNTVAALSLPWSCLVCCLQSAAGTREFPDRVRRIVSALSAARLKRAADRLAVIPQRRNTAVPEVVTSLPEYVISAIESQQREGETQLDDRFEEAFRGRSIDGLLVIRAQDGK